MLSRAQEARVRAILWSSSPLTVQCLEHLSTAAEIPRGHLSDLAVFVRPLHERGDCQRRFGGFCEAAGHETTQTLVWGPPRPQQRYEPLRAIRKRERDHLLAVPLIISPPNSPCFGPSPSVTRTRRRARRPRRWVPR